MNETNAKLSAIVVKCIENENEMKTKLKTNRNPRSCDDWDHRMGCLRSCPSPQTIGCLNPMSQTTVDVLGIKRLFNYY